MNRWPKMRRDTDLLRRLLHHFRSELLSDWRARPEPPSSEIMLRTLAGIEDIAADLAQRRTRKMTGAGMPDGYDFAAGVAHDLRSPLTSILFLAETLHSQDRAATE